jgi:hypothetical protein
MNSAKRPRSPEETETQVILANHFTEALARSLSAIYVSSAKRFDWTLTVALPRNTHLSHAFIRALVVILTQVVTAPPAKRPAFLLTAAAPPPQVSNRDPPLGSNRLIRLLGDAKSHPTRTLAVGFVAFHLQSFTFSFYALLRWSCCGERLLKGGLIKGVHVATRLHLFGQRTAVHRYSGRK